LFDITNPESLWYGYNLYELYQKAYTPWEWHKEIFDYAKSLGMEAFSSPFDESAVDFLEELDVPAYKIASFESAHHPLLKKVAATGKPVIISSGTSKLDEIYESVRILRENGAGPICVLKCTSTYPATAENTNLNTLSVFKSVFHDCLVGLSDHTMGIGVSVAAVALGACVVEKHFTLRRADGGVDSTFSLEPEELKALVVETERAWQAMGRIQLDTQKVEETSRQFRRSIYVTSDIAKGEVFSSKNIRVIRPGDGLAPRHYEEILGKIATKDYKYGEPLLNLQ
jgi:pseudaminic acid synthase